MMLGGKVLKKGPIAFDTKASRLFIGRLIKDFSLYYRYEAEARQGVYSVR